MDWFIFIFSWIACGFINLFFIEVLFNMDKDDLPLGIVFIFAPIVLSYVVAGVVVFFLFYLYELLSLKLFTFIYNKGRNK